MQAEDAKQIERLWLDSYVDLTQTNSRDRYHSSAAVVARVAM